MQPKSIVNSLWIDPVIGELQLLCIKSFVKKGVEFNLYAYNDIINVPLGVKVLDSNRIIDRSLVFKDIKRSYATISDWFRIKLLQIVGGWWVDCDVMCLKTFNFDIPYVFATEAFDYREEKNVRICNAVLKMPSNSIFGINVLNEIEKKMEISSPHEIAWTEIGARILADQIIAMGLSDYVVIPDVFCPNDYSKFKDLVEVENLEWDDNTYGVHLWNKMWEWSNIDPMSQLNNKTFLGKMALSLNHSAKPNE